MKKGLCLLVFLALFMTILFASCNQKKQPGGELDIIPTEPSEGLEFESNGDGTCALIGIGTCTDTYIVIPETSPNGDMLTTIGYNAFLDCDYITGVTIPKGVTCIEQYAFSGCTGISNIHFPASVEMISCPVTDGCSNLVSITVEEGNNCYYSENNCLIRKDVDEYSNNELYTLIAGCQTSIIPEEIEVIGELAFAGCTGLTKIIIPEGVNTIQLGAFAYTSLISVIIPNSVTEIGDAVFAGCANLERIELPGSIKSIGANAFAGCTSLIDGMIPEGVETLGYGVYSGCISLQSVLISNSVSSIGDLLVEGCYSLTSIIVSDDNKTYHSVGNCIVETKSKMLIAGCNTSSIPADGSVTTIVGVAFADCPGLTSIIIPDSVTNICLGAFHGCTGLTSIKVDPDNKMYYSIDNCVIETESGALILGCKNSIIPNSVTSIANFAFADCTELASIIIPNSVSSISEYAFTGCIALTDVYYTGTEEDWRAISIDSDNELLQNATIHYNYIPEE
ncbi:MAG: leucine-rich repeat domain-containing protein [Ruminococcaceae bacterium]|nr:leucine-rich repeat domain-containing protein [Oscillospiraceae bacterium]